MTNMLAEPLNNSPELHAIQNSNPNWDIEFENIDGELHLNLYYY